MRNTTKRPTLILALCAPLLLTACASYPSHQQIGTGLGGVLGAIGGAQIGGGRGRTAAIIAGTLIGATIGRSIGRKMDKTDQMKLSRTLERTPSHSSVSWRNPDSGTQYTVTPQRTYQRSANRYCREYKLDTRIGGRSQRIRSTACRQPDGRWQVQT